MLEHMEPKNKEIMGHLMWVVSQVAKTEGLGNGYRAVINNGRDGSQTVHHLHIHILGGKALGWPPFPK